MKKLICVLCSSLQNPVDFIEWYSQKNGFSKESIIHINTQNVISDIVTRDVLESHCNIRWSDPLSDMVYSEIYDRLESISERSDVDVVYVTGNLFLSKKYEEEISLAARELGYDITITSFKTPMLSLVEQCVASGNDVSRLAKEVDTIEKRFSRLYVPLAENPKVFCTTLDRMIRGENLSAITTIKSILLSGFHLIAWIYDSSITEDDITQFCLSNDIEILKTIQLKKTDPRPEFQFKLDTFWDWLAGYFNIEVIIEDDISSYMRWRRHGINSLFYGNPIAFNSKDKEAYDV